MSYSPSRLPLIGLVIFVGWGCASDPQGPVAQPELNSTAAASYSIHDILEGLATGPSWAFGINDANVVVGRFVTASMQDHAFAWKNGVMTDLGTLPGGDRSSAQDISRDGTIVGYSFNRAGYVRAVRWKNGFKRNLGTLGGKESFALAINDLGVIVGWATTAKGNRHAFKWENGVMTDLTPNKTVSTAFDINRGGAIVGLFNTASGSPTAFRWKNGVLTNLGTHGTGFSRAMAINNTGQIAGDLGPGPGESPFFSSGFVFHRDVWTILPHIRLPSVFVRDISPSGVVIGASAQGSDGDIDPTGDAWVWENGTMSSLPELRSDQATIPEAINSSGNIVGVEGGRAVMWRRQ